MAHSGAYGSNYKSTPGHKNPKNKKKKKSSSNRSKISPMASALIRGK